MAEQRYQAVLAVISDGETVSEVAARFGVARKTVHDWLNKRPLVVLVVTNQAMGLSLRLRTNGSKQMARRVYTGVSPPFLLSQRSAPRSLAKALNTRLVS